eukprot:scaffold3697_cov390-Prasinococcus_capsulatus_cf.AAC.2
MGDHRPPRHPSALESSVFGFIWGEIGGIWASPEDPRVEPRGAWAAPRHPLQIASTPASRARRRPSGGLPLLPLLSLRLRKRERMNATRLPSARARISYIRRAAGPCGGHLRGIRRGVGIRLGPWRPRGASAR